MRRLLLLLVCLSGCDFYFDGDDEPPCAGGGYGAVPPQQLVNPETGQCEPFGGWGGCDSQCGPCPEYAALTIANPDRASCYSQCENLDETSCLGTSGCYAAYDENTDLADAPSTLTFKACHATAPSGPVQGGGCWELSAQECSRHDDCSLMYDDNDYAAKDSPSASTFSRCAPEPTNAGCAAVDCGPGYHCEEQCYDCDPSDPYCSSSCVPACIPDDPGSSCALIDCVEGYTCVEVCDAPAITDGGCIPPSQCYGQCVPVNNGGEPGSCYGEVACDALPPSCPANTTPGRNNGCWTGYCIPNNECGPTDPGTCSTDGAMCATPPPACPANTTPGIRNGCWSGYCIPDHACPVPACETVTTEAACQARPDCTSVYDGDQCTCGPGGCWCETQVFSRCESWGMPQPF